MNYEKPARHGYRRKYDTRADWEREKFRLLTAYRRDLVEWLTEGKPMARTPGPRGPYRKRKKGVAA